MPKVLVVSLAMSDAGKTTAARAAIRFLRSRGLRVGPFKPAGEMWLYKDWSAVSRALDQGRFYGNDAYLLNRDAGSPFAEEVMSPSVRIVAPARHDHSGQYCPTIAARCTLDPENGRHVVAIDPRRLAELGLRQHFGKLLAAPGVTVREFTTLDELGRLVGEYMPQAIAACHRHIAARFDGMVCESAGFSALPWAGLKDFDHVIAINHGYVQLYDGDAYRRSFAAKHEVAVDSNWARDHEPRESAVWRNFSLVRAAQVVAGLPPVAEAAIPPLDGDAIDAGFERAVGSLLAQVEEVA